jgi:hypothetical protein
MPAIILFGVLVAAGGTATATGLFSSAPKEDGPAVQFANPPRTADPTVLVRATASDGQRYVILTSSPAARPEDLCVAVKYLGSAHLGIASSEACLPTGGLGLAATIDQAFGSPGAPFRFVYGIVGRDAAEVRVRDSTGVEEQLPLFKIPGTDLQAFAGSAPRRARAGDATVIAHDGDGEQVGTQTVRLAGPARQAP